MKRYEAELLVFIDADDAEDARQLALEAARQVELRLGNGPHSVAPWVPSVTAARVWDAELVILREEAPPMPGSAHLAGVTREEWEARHESK